MTQNNADLLEQLLTSLASGIKLLVDDLDQSTGTQKPAAAPVVDSDPTQAPPFELLDVLQKAADEAMDAAAQAASSAAHLFAAIRIGAEAARQAYKQQS